MAAEAKLDDPNLQALCDVIGDTGAGLTGGEIGRALEACDIADPFPGGTKRHRLFGALKARQDADRCGNSVLAFVKHVMSPVRYIGRAEEFESRRQGVNSVLAFNGLELRTDGSLGRRTTAQTLSQAEAAASALRRALVERRVHGDVLRFCRAELVAENYCHAVF